LATDEANGLPHFTLDGTGGHMLVPCPSTVDQSAAFFEKRCSPLGRELRSREDAKQYLPIGFEFDHVRVVKKTSNELLQGARSFLEV
jgi:hypothetical protein